MNLPPSLIVCLGFTGVITGRLLFNRWFNHLSLYSLIWGTGLALFELRLIDYYPLSSEVWMVIGYAWIAFVVGSATLVLARNVVEGSHGTDISSPTSSFRLEPRIIIIFIVIFSGIALLAVLRRWSILIDRFGSIIGVLLSGDVIYRLRVRGELAGTIPYLPSFALAAVYLAGLYSAHTGRIKLLVLLPLSIIIMDDIAQAGRAKMLIGGILFLSAYLLATPGPARVKSVPIIGKWKRLLTLGLVLALLVAAAEFVRSYRGVGERFYGMSKELSKIERNSFITPSVYLYLSSHPGVFNAYWKADDEHVFPGSNTFAPLFRILARLGLADSAPHFTRFYNIPIQSNTGTYLRELHADFGVGGILVVPYALGFFCTILWFQSRRQTRAASIAWLAHLYVIVAFSYLYQVTRVGEWSVSLMASLFASYFIDRRRHA